MKNEFYSDLFKAASDQVPEVFGNFAGVGELVFDNLPDLGIAGGAESGGDLHNYLYGLLAV